MNPIHLAYVRHLPHNKFRELFRIIDGLDPEKRDAAMLYTYMQFVKLEIAPDAGPHDTIGDSLTNYTNYGRFKAECQKLPPNLAESFVINGIVYLLCPTAMAEPR